MTMKIPFKFLPGSWGLKGKTRDYAEAEYYLTGEELQRKIAEIKSTSADDLILRNLEIDLEFKHIMQMEYDTQYAELTLEDEELALELARINHENGTLTDREYEKEVKTINKEPYVNVIEIDSDKHSFEFDWNEYFIKDLEDAGYVAPKEEQIVELWFNKLCKNVALEAFAGDGQMDDMEEERKDNLVKIKDLGKGRKEVK